MLVDICSLQSSSGVSAMRRGRRGTRQGATASKVSKWLAPVWEQLLILNSADRAHTAALAPAVECTTGALRKIVHCNCSARGEHRNNFFSLSPLIACRASPFPVPTPLSFSLIWIPFSVFSYLSPFFSPTPSSLHSFFGHLSSPNFHLPSIFSPVSCLSTLLPQLLACLFSLLPSPSSPVPACLVSLLCSLISSLLASLLPKISSLSSRLCSLFSALCALFSVKWRCLIC